MNLGSGLWGAGLLAVLVAAIPAGPAAAVEVIGQVVSIDGDVFAEAPGEEPRRLHCGDEIRREDLVTSTFGGRLGVLVGSVHARLGDGSQVRFDLSPEGSPEFFVHVGRFHVIDARLGSPPPVLVSTPQVEARATGLDTEVWVGDSASFAGTTICEAGSDLQVTLLDGGGSLVTPPGQCAEIGPQRAFAKQPRQLSPLGAAGAPCDELLGPVALNFRDPGLEAPPFPLNFPIPRPVPDPPRGPCEDPGPGCVSVPSSRPPGPPPVPPIVEQPVVPCQIPGLCSR